MSKLYTEMDARELTAAAAPIMGQIKGSKNALGLYLHAVLVHAVKHSDGNVVANLYRLLKGDDINSGLMRATRHAALDCAGFELKCSNPKGGEMKISSKRDQEAWARTKGDISDANLVRLLGTKEDGAGISTFVNRPKVKKATVSSNDDDAGNGEVSNSYETAANGLAAILTELNTLAPNDAEVMGALQTLITLEITFKSKLAELKSRQGARMVANG